MDFENVSCKQDFEMTPLKSFWNRSQSMQPSVDNTWPIKFPWKRLNIEQWREYNDTTNCSIWTKPFKSADKKVRTFLSADLNGFVQIEQFVVSLYSLHCSMFSRFHGNFIGQVLSTDGCIDWDLFQKLFSGVISKSCLHDTFSKSTKGKKVNVVGILFL